MSRRASPAAADTPLMQQYREIKARHRDAILFFRMGDFYEMFYQDAELAARELGLTLTSRNNGGAADVPLAGVPVKAASEYLQRLVERGHRVAICEQVEDPRLAQGIVRREVVETVTPGAALDDGLLERARDNFLVAILPGDAIGVAALDVSTGEFLLETVSPEDLAAALSRADPREVVVPAGATVPVPDGVLRTEREAWEFDVGLAEADLTRRFGLASLDGLGVEPQDRPALGAAGALLNVNAERYEVRPRPARREMDATGAGDVFAATFLVHYHRGGQPWEAAEAAACAAAGFSASDDGDSAAGALSCVPVAALLSDFAAALPCVWAAASGEPAMAGVASATASTATIDNVPSLLIACSFLLAPPRRRRITAPRPSMV